MPSYRHNIDRKLLQYLQGEGISKSEVEEVESWIGRNDKNKAYFEKNKKLWEEKRFIESLKSIDTKKIRAGLQQKIESKKTESVMVPFFKGERLWIGRIAATALILIVSATALLLVRNSSGNPVVEVNSTGEITETVLSDGSNIELNKGSTLSYPEQMKRGKREVILSGEAFFQVASKKRTPFYVYVGKTTVKVLGTSFNLKEGEGRITLSVLEGEVRFFESGKKNLALSVGTGQKAVYYPVTGTFDQATFDSHNFLYWRTSTLTFRETPLSEVFRELEDHFRITFVTDDKGILQYRINTTCREQQLDEILHELSLLRDLEYTRKNDTIFVQRE